MVNVPKSGTSGRPSLSEIRKRVVERTEGHTGRGPAAKRTPGDKPADQKRVVGPTGRSGIGKKGADRTEGRGSMKVVESRGAKWQPGKSANEKPAKRAFSERQRSGDLARLAHGKVAKKVKLDEQFKMRNKGDVARRLGLHKGGGHSRGGDRAHGPRDDRSLHRPGGPHGHRDSHRDAWHVDHHHRGRVSPRYGHGCFWTFYCGPSYYPHYCWYPRWSPWVDWSWHYHCHAVWDPRPFWCRPVVYVAAPRWVYWDVPVWTPLPVATCGTWVDVEPVVVGPEYDLQLMAIRFVDAGHPDESIGPRYRVWFRNNSEKAISQPFDVLLFASSDESLSAGQPQAGVRVTSIGGGEVQSVDVRLPIEASVVGIDAQDQPTSPGTLQVLVDANRHVAETDEANNGATVRLEEVLPVDPAAFELEPSTAPAGSEVVLAGEGFGPAPGQVLLHLGGIEMEAEILGWYDLGVKVALPDLPLAGPSKAELIVIRGDGAAANPMEVTISPPDRDEKPMFPVIVAPQGGSPEE